ncbi:hypothetical protein B0T21DRAFT_408732 [Apiosordaria backusii]|uniref:ADP-ribose 1''-phosphate phosphatase n=1 Tax=Apiosordaria backusii TaxID=314023 RepID=A0AA40EM39_9PEZI|nr:hypothetical protein B0T21DRAFT_408732 [Apiosordaria backusii]
MASKRRIGTAFSDSSKSANRLITDFWGAPSRPKRQKTEDHSLNCAAEPEQATMAPSSLAAVPCWEDKPSLTDLDSISQEHVWEAEDIKSRPQKQQQKVDTVGLDTVWKRNQHQDHGKASSKPYFHPLPDKTPSVPRSRRLVLTHQKGDLFDAPPDSVLIHACNTIGKWGGGIAATFKKYYPAAFESDRYRLVKDDDPTGHPNPVNDGQGDEVKGDEAKDGDASKPTHEKDIHYVACVFTSKSIGAHRDPPEMILKNTEKAMKNLMFQLSNVKFNQKDCPYIPQVRMCMINSGLFGASTLGEGDFKVVVVSKEGAPEKKKKVLGDSNVRSKRS